MEDATSPPRTILPSPSLLEDRADLDGAVDALRSLADSAFPEGDGTREALQGDWLGHPVHPVMTDIVIGFWTSAFVLDFFPVKRLRAAADFFVALGLVSVVPTVATGLADFTTLDRPKQRVAAVHAGANAVGAGLYAISLANRVRGRRARGIAFGMLGATAMTVGGYLGGHLAFGDVEAEGDEPNVPRPSA